MQIMMFYAYCKRFCINDGDVKQLLEKVTRGGEIVTLSGEICFFLHIANKLP